MQWNRNGLKTVSDKKGIPEQKPETGTLQLFPITAILTSK